MKNNFQIISLFTTHVHVDNIAVNGNDAINSTLNINSSMNITYKDFLLRIGIYKICITAGTAHIIINTIHVNT